MKKIFAVVSTSVTSVVAACLIAAPAYAWHPQGTIVKEVQNQTAGTAKSDANDAASAVVAAPGDTLMYTITVSNVGAAASNGDNDMAGTTLTDTLPAGLDPVGSTQRTINENLGTIKPGKSVTRTYTVKVTSTTDGAIITNEACFNGDSLAHDKPQHGCNSAVIKVHVPPVTPPSTPTTPTTPELPAKLPNTGSTGLVAGVTALGALVLGYGVNALRLKFRRD